MNNVITLISTTTEPNEYGDRVTEESRREVFCEKISVGMKEFYQSQTVGLKPEIKVKLSDYYDYNGEILAEFDGIRYSVLRTYQKGLGLELTLTRGVIDDVST